MSAPSALCPRCGAPRVEATDCPACGVIYARAEARARAGSAGGAPKVEAAVEPAPPEAGPVLAPALEVDDTDDDPWEAKVRLFALPAALALGHLFVLTGPGGVISRLISGMWLHELGHASAAWLFGYSAVPLPWFTSISQHRSYVVTVIFVVLWGYLSWRAFWTGRPLLSWALLGLSLLHLGGGLLVGTKTAQMLITFWGDGGAMAYGSLLVCTLYAPPGSRLRRGGLRWGFLFLGAIGFADIFQSWLRARADVAEIPFGHIHGVGLSDASKLVEVHRWSEQGLVNAHLAVGAFCLAGLAVLYVLVVLRARRGGA